MGYVDSVYKPGLLSLTYFAEAQLDLTYMTELYTSEHDNVEAPDREPLNVEHIADDLRPKTAFDRLVLEKGHKEMILSLTAQHFRDKESSTGSTKQVDIVKGKGISICGSSTIAFAKHFPGKGLIILLHGAPGVGKTSTAGSSVLFPLFPGWSYNY